MADSMMCGDYPLDEVISALQKEIRRGNKFEAHYWALELCDGGFAAYMWRRLAVIAVEDCHVSTLPIVHACYCLSELATQKFKSGQAKVETNALAKAILCMCETIKDREACDFDMVVLKMREKGLKLKIPEYAVDGHTTAGKKAGITGKTKLYQFYIDGSSLDKSVYNRFLKQALEILDFPEEGVSELLLKQHAEVPENWEREGYLRLQDPWEPSK